VAFIISMAGSAVSGKDVLLVQNRRLLEVAGISEEDITHMLEIASRAYEMTVTNDPGLEDVVRELAHFQIEMASEEELAGIGDIDAYIEAQIPTFMEAFTNNWYRYFLTYNPGDYWAQVDVPVLGLFGELDVQVDAEQNSSALEAALENNPDIQIVFFPTANHLFQEAVTGGVEEYSALEPNLLPDFLPTVSAWLLAHVTVVGE
jgi:hypothetical protein